MLDCNYTKNGIDNIPDYEIRIKRQDYFFDNEIIDRPVVLIPVYKPYESKYKKDYKLLRDKWLDFDFVSDCIIEQVENTEYYGDALPNIFPNLGPEILSAFCGCELEFGETTSWSIPIIDDWERDIDKIAFSEDNFYFKKINEFTDILLQKGVGKFYTGLTDLHPGGDAIAAFRDPERLNMDLIDDPDYVKEATLKFEPIYYKIFNYFYDKLIKNNQPCSTWHHIVSSRRFYIASNDFSCMISDRMFKEFFLQGIIDECKFYGNTIYHLDGPNALSHLDTLLEIKELNAIQWVPGAGLDVFSDDFNLPILKKIQGAGKGIQFYIRPNELDTIMENLKPQGVHLTVYTVKDKDEADNLLKRIKYWV